MSAPFTTTSPTRTGGDPGGRDIIGEVDELFASTDYGSFCRHAIEYVVELTTARTCLLYGSDRTGKMVPRAEYHRQGCRLDPGFLPELETLAKFTRESVRSQKVTMTSGDNKLAALAVPFQGADGASVIVLLLGPERAPFLEPTFGIVSLYAAVMANYGSQIEFARTREAFLQSTLLVDLYTKTATSPDYESAMAVLTSELQEWIGCDHLALGMERKGRMKLDSISGRKQREKRSKGLSGVLNLMREISAAETSVIWPSPERMDFSALVASNQDDMLSVFSVNRIVGTPLIAAADDRKGAMVVMWREGDQPTPEKFELLTAMAPHLVALIFLLSEGLPTGLRGKLRKFSRESSMGKKAATVLGPLALVAAMFVPVPHHVRGAVRLTPDVSRQVAAPIGGILEGVKVKPGDVVEQGELLAVLDGKEIGWRLAEAVAKRDVAAKRRDQARAEKNVPATQLARHEYEALALEVELLQYQKENLEIRSPIAGLVLSGDLERSKGVPVETGQKLFEVASTDRFVAEIAINDEDINWVEPEQAVSLRLESRGGRVFRSDVAQVYPVSEVNQGDNVFICLAPIVDEDGASFLRAGMRGRARIDSGWKPLGWILFHKPWNYVKLRLF